VLRYYSIFNTEQCELPATMTDKLALPENRQLDPIEACEQILAGMPNPPEIVHGGDKAFYSPMTDRSPRHRADCLKTWTNTGPHSGTRPRMQVGTKETQARIDQRCGVVWISGLQQRGGFGAPCRRD
jgi:hypothetical protein